MTWVVAGLGNPGEPYARTRHNLGAMVVGELASREGLRFRRVRFLPVDVAEIKVDGERLLLARSHRFMNDSGPSYASLAKKNGVNGDRVIAVHDELDLPFGALKLKLGGSTAGHNGLNSLVDALRGPDFYRVRLGIGRPSRGRDPIDWVLEPFGRSEEADVALLVDDAADAVMALARDGLPAAQDRFNRNGPREA